MGRYRPIEYCQGFRLLSSTCPGVQGQVGKGPQNHWFRPKLGTGSISERSENGEHDVTCIRDLTDRFELQKPGELLAQWSVPPLAVAPCSKIYSLSKRLRLDCCMLQQHRQHVCEAALLQTAQQSVASWHANMLKGAIYCSSASCHSCHADKAPERAMTFHL